MESPVTFASGGILADVSAGIRARQLWLDFGWLDVKLKYRRTVLGPFWMTLSFAVSVAALGLVYSSLFGIDIEDFLPYLACGLAIWTLIASMVVEGCTSFTSAQSLILQYNHPLSVHVLRPITRNAIMFAHTLAVLILLGIVFGVDFSWTSLLAIPAFALILANGLWIGILLGVACARYRDLPQIVMMVINVVFFVTPVFWRKDMLGSRGFIADYNPFYHFVDIFRASLIGDVATAQSWLIVASITVGGSVVTLLVANRHLRRVSYWL